MAAACASPRSPIYRSPISTAPEVVGTLCGRDAGEDAANSLADAADGAFGGLPKERLQLRKGLLDPRVKPEDIEVGTVARQEQQPSRVAATLQSCCRVRPRPPPAGSRDGGRAW